MTFGKDNLMQWWRWGGRTLVLFGFIVGVIVLMLYLAGKFAPKVPTAGEQQPLPAAEQVETAPVRLIRLPRVESAVGTIRAVHETSLGSKLLARVVEVRAKAGEVVRRDDLLVRLDDADLRARLRQAEAAVDAAEARRIQADADEKRYAQLVKTKTVSRQQYDDAVAQLRAAEADLNRAKANVTEVQSLLDSTVIRAPMDAVVIDKKVEAGDMVAPGQVLVTLFDPKRMQLVAGVRESLALRLQIGQNIGVRIEGLDRQCDGTISEIVPEAQSASRTFQVKVTGPCPPGVYSGMFGRLLIPLDEEQVLVIPRRAVRNVGQLQLVNVLVDGRPMRRSIRTGRTFGDDVEVLAGLREGEQVALPAAWIDKA